MQANGAPLRTLNSASRINLLPSVIVLLRRPLSVAMTVFHVVEQAVHLPRRILEPTVVPNAGESLWSGRWAYAVRAE